MLQATFRFVLTQVLAILLTAAGLVFSAKVLFYAGILLSAAVATAWIFLKVHPIANSEARRDAENRRRQLIADARRLAQSYTQNDKGRTFREFLEGSLTYPELRPHLSAEYLSKLNAPGVKIYAMADDARYEPLVEWYLDDVDRLEAIWGLR